MLSFRSVIYRDNKEVLVSNPTDFPDVAHTTSKVKEIREPVVNAAVITPEGWGIDLIFLTVVDRCDLKLEYFGDMMELCYSHRAERVDHRYLDSGTTTSPRIMLTCTLPFSEIVTNFFDQLKSRSSGFASFE